MKSFLFLFVATMLTHSIPTFAAIDCRPGMGNCPDQPSTPHPLPTPSEITVIGYSEVASPDCTIEDLDLAIKHAERKAIADAHAELGPNAQLIQPFRYSKSCQQSFYAGSFKGNSWMVQAFAIYAP